jgi:general L-amino acid transport system permease protein
LTQQEDHNAVAVSVRTHERPPFWRNITVLKWIAQIVMLVVAVALATILGREAFKNFNASGISFSFDFLSDPPLVQLREGIDINPDSGARALYAGIVNTLRVALSGIVAATLLGTLIGVARLSRNWIINKLATVYIETIRNIPLLVQIFFWSALVTTTLPSLERGDEGVKWFHASNKGIATTWVFPSTGFWPWFIIVLIGGYVAFRVARSRRTFQETTGEEGHIVRYATATFLGIALVGWFAHPLLAFLGPVWDGVASVIRSVPPVFVSVLIAAGGLAAAGWWIRNFFESRRTPAGFGKLTDDDIFRIVFAALSGLAVVVLAFVVGGFSVDTPNGAVVSLVELLRNGLANIFNWFGDKFDQGFGGPLTIQRPSIELRGSGGFVQYALETESGAQAGLLITPPFFSIWVGVTLYTAAFIAEIVRGGILAVSKGQTEAAMAVGLKRSQYLRLIILPQAFRIILPPIGNQYLNLAKNTSLGIAVAFSDIVQVGTTILNQTGQSLPVVVIWMGFFLTLSLALSAVVNYYNRKLKLVER